MTLKKGKCMFTLAEKIVVYSDPLSQKYLDALSQIDYNYFWTIFYNYFVEIQNATEEYCDMHWLIFNLSGMYFRKDSFVIPFGGHFCGNWVTKKWDFSPIFSPNRQS